MIIFKSVTYRIYSIIISLTVFYILTGKLEMAGQFAFIIETVKLFQYFIFEKMWFTRKNKSLFLRRRLNKLRKAVARKSL